jgi:hypothetical protein
MTIDALAAAGPMGQYPAEPFFGLHLQRAGPTGCRQRTVYPFIGVLISPIWASAAMTFSSVSVIANALRLRRVEL